MTKRKRKTDHDKMMETLRVLAPTLQEGLRTVGSWVAIPAVGITLLWFGMIVQRNLIKKADGSPRFQTAEEHFGAGSLEKALGLAVVASAVVPAAEAASKFIGPMMTGLMGGGPTGGAPIG